MSKESVKLFAVSNSRLIPALNYIHTKMQAKFDRSCLKQVNVTFTHEKLVDMYTVFEINLLPFDVDKNFLLRNFLLGDVKFIKSVEILAMALDWMHVEIFVV